MEGRFPWAHGGMGPQALLEARRASPGKGVPGGGSTLSRGLGWTDLLLGPEALPGGWHRALKEVATGRPGHQCLSEGSMAPGPQRSPSETTQPVCLPVPGR